MRYLEAFRNPKAAAALRARIHDRARALPAGRKRVAIMEVCGSHTMAVSRYGIRQILPEQVELISGPGCPVCVTPPGYVDAAIELARSGIIIVTFGDMLNVPGSAQSLAQCRAAGGRIEICYSPTAALELAAGQPDREVVFLAIGFETTIAPVVSLVPEATRRGIDNLSLLTAFKLVPPALSALLADADVAVEAGADYLGFVQYKGSQRYVKPDIVRQIKVPSTVKKVGVFVNAPVNEILRVIEYAGLDIVQLHGAEQPVEVEQIGAQRVWKSFALKVPADVRVAAAFPAAMVLVDAFAPRRHGGTGHCADWKLARKLAEQRPVILAGGLSPANVQDALATVRPVAVDASSSLESQPGVKNPTLVREFVEQVRNAKW